VTEKSRQSRVIAKVLRLVYGPRPRYEFFVDAETYQPWFAVFLFSLRKDWDSYSLLRVLRRFMIDMDATARQLDDARLGLLIGRMTSVIDAALSTEPLEGEEHDGKLHDDL
jgi:hypothetical protein